MQRRLIRALTTSFLPLIGLAVAFAMSGCAAVPAISLANSLMHPSQTVQASAQPDPAAPGGAQAASPDMISALAQHFGVTWPTGGSAPAVRTATAPSFTTAPDTTTTAAR